MVKGLALTIGLNALDPAHYAGWSGELNACESDAEDMAEIAKSQGFNVTTLLTKNATRQKVMEEIRNASKTLNSGDIFMLNYSGHGGQVPDLQDDEPDGLDETWCLYNGQLVDDEHYLLLGEFAKGIRILSFSDSCHSGTMLKMAFYRDKVNLEISNEGSPKFRCMPKNIENRTYRDNKDFYDKILNNPKLKNSEERVKASALLISGCQDNQLSEDGTFNGLFTSQVLRVWKNGLFKGDYRKFYKTIVNRMPRDQTPNYYRVGTRNTRFERQRPFTV